MMGFKVSVLCTSRVKQNAYFYKDYRHAVAFLSGVAHR